MFTNKLHTGAPPPFKSWFKFEDFFKGLSLRAYKNETSHSPAKPQRWARAPGPNLRR